MNNNYKTDFIRRLGRKIAHLRKQHGLNQFEFADKSGKMINTISKIERGIGDPRLSTLLDIADALDTSLLDLLNLQTYDSVSSSEVQNSEFVLKDILDNINQCDEKTLQLFALLLKTLKK